LWQSVWIEVFCILVHNYVFTLHALNTEKLNAPAGATSALVRFFINQHTIAKTTLSIVAGPRK
jgi:phosphatidylethanolamine-binding protein (PEBP) family uncharacterized protein